MPSDDPFPGAHGEPLSAADMYLIRQALRQDWPLAPVVKQRILQRLVDYLDTDTDEGATCSDRVVIGAARAVASFCALSLKQQAVDLAVKKFEGGGEAVPLSELVDAAEKRAEERIIERS